MNYKTRLAEAYASTRSAAADSRAAVGRALRCGPITCLRLAAAVSIGLIAAVGAVAFVLLALAILVPAAAVVILCAGLALLAWPFTAPAA